MTPGVEVVWREATVRRTSLCMNQRSDAP